MLEKYNRRKPKYSCNVIKKHKGENERVNRKRYTKDVYSIRDFIECSEKWALKECEWYEPGHETDEE